MSRRFIAGAVCPQCRALDRIVVETSSELSRRLCIECNFSEDLDGQPPAPALPQSRLLKPQHRNETQSTPVRILEPKSSHPEPQRNTGASASDGGVKEPSKL